MIENLDSQILFYLWKFPVNATIFYSWIIIAVLGIGSYCITRHLSTGPYINRTQIILEMIVNAARQQIHSITNDNPAKYMSFISSLFLFIAMSNLLSIIPWFNQPTASLSTTAAFAFCVFIAIPYYGIKNAGIKGYLKKFISPTPLMLPLNILSDFSSTFALAFRLYGNMLSGAIIITVLMMLAPFIVPLPLQLLGLLTGMIQAYIFALLAIVYVSAVAPTEAFVESDTKKQGE